MKNIYRNLLYFLPIICILLTQDLFFPFPHVEKVEESPNFSYIIFMGQATKIIPFIALIFAFVKILESRLLYQSLFYLALVSLTFLTFESLYYYNSFIEFPHVFLKILDLFMVFAFYLFYKEKTEINFNVLMYLILIVLVLKIIIDPNMLTLNAFLEHERGLPAAGAYILLLPCLYFFNVYVEKLDKYAFVSFLFLLSFLIFIQQRTVWIASISAFAFNILILIKNKNLKISNSITNIIPLTILMFFLSFLTLTYFPDVKDKILESVDQIANPAQKETTSDWRFEQMESYLPYVKDHPIVGMRLKGFELPIQYYHSDIDYYALFMENTGHHFHSFYFDRLFYFGMAGLILMLVLSIIPIIILFKNNLKLSPQKLAFVSFTISGIIFGFGYNLPFYYWVFLGITWAIVETEYQRAKNISFIN